jgi:adenylate cyclase
MAKPTVEEMWRAMHKHPGGAKVEISVLFADVRGSTGIAERMAPGDFSSLLARFYGTTADVIDEHDGIVDKFVGEGGRGALHSGLRGETPRRAGGRGGPAPARGHG